jgi:hypothetical protein
MDIARLSTELATQRIQDQVGMAVMGKALDFASEQSAALTKMLESAAPVGKITDPALGGRIDLLV